MRQAGPSSDSPSSGDRPQDSRVHERQPMRPQHPSSDSSMSHTALPPIHQLQLPPSASTSSHGGPAALHPPHHPPEHPHAFHRGSQHPIYGSPPSRSQHETPPHLHTYQDRDERRHPEWVRAPAPFGATSITEQSGSAGAESDQEETAADVQGPPKKKRRRQALSCTECKRRKIKCDRLNPCGPCQRRSEPDKCHWHVVEPIEKYVTRAEWDDLNAKFRNLEDYCKNLTALVYHLHPEIASHFPLEPQATGLPALPSPTSLRASATRSYSLSGPGVSGFQRGSPSQPLSLSATASGVHSLPLEPTLASPVVTAPPHTQQVAATPSHSRPSPASPRTHPPQHSDRRTSASGVREQVAERIRHQVPGMSATAMANNYSPFQQIQPSPKPPNSFPNRSPSGSASLVPGSPLQQHQLHQQVYSSDASQAQEGRYRTYPPSLPQLDSQRQQQQPRRNPLALSSIVDSEQPHSPSVPFSPPGDATIASPRAYHAVPRQAPPRTASPILLPKKGRAQTSNRTGEGLRRLSPSPPYSTISGTNTRLLLRDTSSRLATMDVSDSHAHYPRTAEVHYSGSRSGTSTPVMSCTSAASRTCRPSLHFSIPPSSSNPATPPPQLAIH